MASSNEYKETIESYRKRLMDEIVTMNSNSFGFIDARNTAHEVRALINVYRSSIEKCNLYLGYMEEINERRIRHEELSRTHED